MVKYPLMSPSQYLQFEVVEEGDEDPFTLGHCDLYESQEEVAQSQEDQTQQSRDYASMKSSLFKTDRFLKLNEMLRLENDSISKMRHFYEQLGRNARASHSLGATVLPAYQDLVPGIQEAITPTSSDYYFMTQAAAFVDLVSSAIYDFLIKPRTISERYCQKTYLQFHSCSSRDGLMLLWHLLTVKIPFLGATLVDLNSHVSRLVITTGDTMSAFMAKCVKVERMLEDAGAVLSPNLLFAQILNQFRRVPSCIPFVHAISKEYFKQQRRTPNAEFTATPSKKFLDEFIENGVDLTMQLLVGPKQTFAPRTYAGSRPNTMERPNIRTIELDDESHEVPETLQSIEGNDSPFFEQPDETGQPDPTETPAVHAIDSGDPTKPPCGICENRNHGTIGCRLFHKSNVPEMLQRRAAQWRLRLSNEVQKLDAKRPTGNNFNAKPPVPPKPFIKKVGFDPPKFNTISADTASKFNSETPAPESMICHEVSDYQPATQDGTHLIQLEEMLRDTVGTTTEESTPVVATAAADGEDLIVDFGEQANLIPIGAEFEEPLDPADYEAYSGSYSSLNW